MALTMGDSDGRWSKGNLICLWIGGEFKRGERRVCPGGGGGNWEGGLMDRRLQEERRKEKGERTQPEGFFMLLLPSPWTNSLPYFRPRNHNAPSVRKVSFPHGSLVRFVKPAEFSHVCRPLMGPAPGILMPFFPAYPLPCALIVAPA